ncbi:alcohol dehydrogenase [Bacillus sp. FJAT-27225]|uniref:zinc-binding dehydrogenase n=1 Tax=Bacillus sp. FJAT-27225 TaxID=1743144 RepID=UPI00080C332B|nr:zinc-binding dehydrogenase [Bacillus sp. FJAT-27225]OCA90541.1 alcohol dehydrogenase [Bacillus sp. FJAT-27225]
MKGWEFTDTNVSLKLVEKPDPIVLPGEVVVDVKAAGLCHTDVSALEDPGWKALFGELPVIFGHECAGIISAIGENVTGFKVGDRVGVHPITKAGEYIGFQRDGGYATKIMVPADTLVPIPDSVGFDLGAMATDAGMTSYQSIRVGGAKEGMKVGIIGIGGLGQLATRAAVLKGCEVYAVDVNPEARALAKTLGVKEAFENISDLEPIECELIVDFAGFGETTSQALDVIRKFGTIVVVGMGKLESNINTYNLILKQAKIIGSNGGTHQDIAEMYKLFATGKLNPQYSTISFEEIPEGLERLKRGEVKGRLVALVD